MAPSMKGALRRDAETSKNPLRRKKDSDAEPQAWRAEGLPGEDSAKRGPKYWITVGVTFLALWMALFFGYNAVADHMDPTYDDLPYTEFYKQVESGNLKRIAETKANTIEGELKKSATYKKETYRKFVTERPTWWDDDLVAKLQKDGVEITAKSPIQSSNPWLGLLESLLIIVAIGGVWYWVMRKQLGGGLFGSSGDHKPVDPDKNRVTFDDVAGIDEVEDQLREVVDMLRNPDKYTRLGAKIPRGILLEGGPGTGKTLLARATAGEAQVPFFSISAAEIGGILAGKGASDVRNLFKAAREVAPAIIFIDEIDAIGRSRQRASGIGGNEDREQTLNQILTEMDGFEADSNIIVVAATNLAEVLDSALTRAGRFDRTITVSAPDQNGREAILKVHVREHPLAPDVSLEALAKSTPGLTGADIANLVNEASLLAARESQEQIRMKDFTNALETIQLGVERAVVMGDEERERTAWHEGGHALLGMIQPGADPVRKISIIPRGRALGVTLSTPENDKYGYDKEYLRGRIIGALGGMAAEQEIYGVITTGADSDLQQATNIARQMFGRWGMSEKIGPIQVYPLEGDPRAAGASEALLQAVDDEVRAYMAECYEEARRLLREHRPQHQALVDALLEKETLDEDEAYAIAGITRKKDESHIVAAPADRPRGRHSRPSEQPAEEQAPQAQPETLPEGKPSEANVEAEPAPTEVLAVTQAEIQGEAEDSQPA